MELRVFLTYLIFGCHSSVADIEPTSRLVALARESIYRQVNIFRTADVLNHAVSVCEGNFQTGFVRNVGDSKISQLQDEGGEASF